tara:strand:- start:6391 stop:6585 length:195 start_codon:yes stop_codon:yes gene_type:complete
MLTVSISINNEPLYCRSARRQQDNIKKGQKATYKTDAGDIIEFTYGDNIIELAKKILDTIKQDY